MSSPMLQCSYVVVPNSPVQTYQFPTVTGVKETLRRSDEPKVSQVKESDVIRTQNKTVVKSPYYGRWYFILLQNFRLLKPDCKTSENFLIFTSNSIYLWINQFQFQSILHHIFLLKNTKNYCFPWFLFYFLFLFYRWELCTRYDILRKWTKMYKWRKLVWFHYWLCGYLWWVKMYLQRQDWRRKIVWWIFWLSTGWRWTWMFR